MKHFKNHTQNGWRDVCVCEHACKCVCLAFSYHLPLGEGDIKKLLFQMWIIYFHFTQELSHFRKAVVDDQIVLSVHNF